MSARSKGGRWGHRVRRILFGLTTFVVLLGAVGVFVLGTSAGGWVALAIAQRFLPDESTLEVQGFSGRLVGRFELTGVRFGIPSLEVEARRVAVDWRAGGLLAKKIEFRAVGVEGAVVTLLPAPPDSASQVTDAPADGTTGPPGADFPYEVSFDSLRVSGLTFRMQDSIWISGGSATLSGNLDEYRLSFRGQGAVPGLATAEVAVAGSGSLTAFHAEAVDLATLDGVISGTGDATWWPDLSWIARLEARDLAPGTLLPDPDAWPGRVSLTAQTKGSASGDAGLAAEASIDTLFGVLRGEPLNGRFDIRATARQVDVEAARISWGPASVRVAGRVGDTIEADFQATVPDLGLVLPGVAGSLSASGSASGTVDAPRVRTTFAADSLRVGPVSAAAVQGNADLDLANRVSGTVTARDLTVSGRSLDSARVSLSGLVGRHDLEASVRGPNGGLDLEATGGLSPSNVWSGTLLSLRLTGDSARDWTLAEPAALKASTRAVELGEACFESPPARVCLAGERSDRLTRLRAAADSFEVARLDPLLRPDVSARGIVNAAVDLEYVAGGELTGTVDVRTGPGHVEWSTDGESRRLGFEPITLTAASGTDGTRGELELHIADSTQARMLTISGHVESPATVRSMEDFTRLAGQPFSIRLEIDASDVGLLAPVVLRRWDVAGRLRAVVDLTADAEGRLNGTLDAHTDSLRLRNTVRGHGWALAAEPVRIQAAVGPDGLTAGLEVEVSTTGSDSLLTAHGRLSVPGFTRLDSDPGALPLEGRLDVNLTDLSVVEAILPELSDASGTFELHTKVAGTLADATVQGEAHLREGRAVVPDLGLDLTGIRLAVVGRPEGGLDIDGEVHSGPGKVTIVGHSERRPAADTPTRIQVRGQGFRVADIPEMQIDANPSVDVLFDGSTLQLNGEILIPSARVGIPDIPEAAITPSEDVIIVGDTTTVKEPPVPFGADLTVTLGDDVFFDGVGLTGNLVGQLSVTQRPGGEPTGRGELRLNNGIFRTLGQELRIDPGRLLFNGPIDDPGVDARAFVRAGDQTEAGFRIRGTLQHLDISTYSVPPKSESDIMAYILFGRPMSQTSGTEGSQASNTAAVLGANMLAMSLAPSLGLDEARIDTGSSQNKAQLVVGKYLSPKLYVGYGVGLYEPISTFRVRYLLSARWSIEAITGDQQSTDLLYRIETGGSPPAEQAATRQGSEE